MFPVVKSGSCEVDPSSVAWRPQDEGRELQLLLFATEGIYEIHVRHDQIREGPKLQTTGVALQPAGSAVYEPSTDSIVFVMGKSERALMRLDRDNRVSPLAGSSSADDEGAAPVADGAGSAARFLKIKDLQADGHGQIYLLDGKSRIRKVDAVSGEVTTLPGVDESLELCNIAFDTAASVLVASSGTAIYRVVTSATSNHAAAANAAATTAPPALQLTAASTTAAPASALTATTGNTAAGPAVHLRAATAAAPATPLAAAAVPAIAAPALQLVAGHHDEEGQTDGHGPSARFHVIQGLAFGTDGSLFAAEYCGGLRCIPNLSAANVSTVLEDGLAINASMLLCLPTGDLMSCGCDPQDYCIKHVCMLDASVSTHLPGGELHDLLVSPANGSGGSSEEGGGGGSAASSSSSAIVTVKAGGKAFVAHRALLAARSEYFRRLLSPGCEFAESGAGEVSLPDADPEAFGWLLTAMYDGRLGKVPVRLLRPVAALSQRLLLSSAFRLQLQARLVPGVTVDNVVSELAWAYQHDLADLVAQLMAFLVQHRKEVTQEMVGELAARHPMLAAELLKALMVAA